MDELVEKIVKSDLVQRQLDVTGVDHIEVHISEDGKRLWVNNEFTCILRVCRIKSFHLRDDRSRKEEDTKWAIEFLKSLYEDEVKTLLRICTLITDPLSQELLKKAAEEMKG